MIGSGIAPAAVRDCDHQSLSVGPGTSSIAMKYVSSIFPSVVGLRDVVVAELRSRAVPPGRTTRRSRDPPRGARHIRLSATILREAVRSRRARRDGRAPCRPRRAARARCTGRTLRPARVASRGRARVRWDAGMAMSRSSRSRAGAAAWQGPACPDRATPRSGVKCRPAARCAPVYGHERARSELP